MALATEVERAAAREAAHESLLAYIIHTRDWFSVARHHLALIDALEAVERGEIKRLIITMPPRHGKALALDTPIPTPGGWTTMGDIRVGDLVFGRDGEPTRVTGKSQVLKDRPVYRVETQDGEHVVADGEHLWLSRLDRGHPVEKLYTTRALAERSSPRNPMVRVARPIQAGEADLRVDPWILGYWLGDGCKNDGGVTVGGEHADWFVRQAESRGYLTRRAETGLRIGVLGLMAGLREIGVLGNKRIPLEYLRASEPQRLELLRGLMDSDGDVSPRGQCFFTTTNPALRDGVLELVRSLGVKASQIEGVAKFRGRDCGLYWRVAFYLEGCASIPHKAVRTRNAGRTPNHYIRVVPAGVADTVCIKVEASDGMFLCGKNFLPTHNTEVASRSFPAWFLGRNPDKEVIIASYGEGVAQSISGNIRDQFDDELWPFPDVRLKPGRRTVGDWGIDGHRGGLKAAGVRGALTGRGASLAIIDDPVKDRTDADSVTMREKTIEWYHDVLMTRLTPDGAVIVIQTRWHAGDLAGYLIREMNDGKGEKFHILNMPLLAYEPGEAPPWVPPDPLARAPGEVLWPDWYTLEWALHRKATEPDRTWSALRQQLPSTEAGLVFKMAWMLRRYQNWKSLDIRAIEIIVDSAFSEGVGTSTSCIAVWAHLPHEAALLDIWQHRVGYEELIQGIIDMATKWRGLTGMTPLVVIEKKASGQSAIQTLTTREGIVSLSVVPFPDPNDEGQKRLASSSKEARADNATVMFKAGQVLLPEAEPWLENWIRNHLAFPTAETNDDVDTTSMMAARFALAGPIASSSNMTPGSQYREKQGALDRFRESVYNADRGARFGSGSNRSEPSGYNARRGGRLS